jgi:hypothetical protein
MAINHAFQSNQSDGADTTLVRPSNWNADHTWLADSADPSSPVDGQVWVTISGVTPTRVAALKIYDGGVTRTIASITY